MLTEQDENIVNAFSFRVKRPQDVELFAEELARQGIETLEVPAGTERGRGTAVRFLVPGSQHPFELDPTWKSPSRPRAMRSRLPSNSSKRRGLGVRRIDHFNVQTSPDTINQAERWVRDTLGFKRREFAHLADRRDTVLASWMSVTPQVHDLAMVANAAGKAAQLHHVAFNLQDFSDVLTAADTLRDLDVSYGVGPGKHGIGQAMYLYAPRSGLGPPGRDHAGGYLIFDPDWKAIEWQPEAFPEGMTWYGDPIGPARPGSRGRDTTGCAGLYLPQHPRPKLVAAG